MARRKVHRGVGGACWFLLATTLWLAATPGVAGDRETGEDARTIRARAEWFRDLRRGPDGLIPYRARRRALEQLEKGLQDGTLRHAGRSPIPTVWWSVGPEELLDGTASYSGRVTSLAVHPGNPDIVYVGTAQGGVWKTTNGGASWAPLTDGEESLAVGSIALDPSDPQKVYAGTGEPYDSCSTYFGVGILRSTDGGGTWTLLGEQDFAGTSISRVLVDPGDSDTLWVTNAQGWAGFVCTAAPGAPVYGVHKSTDGGATWTLMLGSGQTGAPSYVYDLVIDPANPGVLYAAVDGSGIWKTVDGGSGWSKLVEGLPASGFGRIDLALDPNDGQTIYAAFERAGTSTYLGTWKSTDGGATWLSLPPVPTGGTCQVSTFRDPCSYQGQSYGLCNYALYVEVAPSGTLWLGGVVLWRSTDGGSSWIDSCPVDMHVDQHAAAFSSDGRVWVGNDGGVFVSADGGATWSARNRGLVTAQFYPGAAVHPSGALMLGGTQDNGARLFPGGAPGRCCCSATAPSMSSTPSTPTTRGTCRGSICRSSRPRMPG